MKANELQIGDWLQVDRTYPPIGTMKPIRTTLQDLIWIEQGKEFAPIPLTTEILEKNGFKLGRMFMSMAWNNDNVVYADGSFDNHIDISLAGFDNHSEYVNIRVPFSGLGMPLHYVHELQHALRLCGLNDLADNFKVW